MRYETITERNESFRMKYESTSRSAPQKKRRESADSLASAQSTDLIYSASGALVLGSSILIWVHHSSDSSKDVAPGVWAFVLAPVLLVAVSILVIALLAQPFLTQVPRTIKRRRYMAIAIGLAAFLLTWLIV